MVNAVPAAATSAQLGESPLWDAEVGLRWLDVEGRRLFTLDLDGQESSVALSNTVTAVELARGEDLLSVTKTGIGWLNPASGMVDQAKNMISDEAITMNDGAIDARGRCWVGSAVRDGSWRGSLFRIEGDSVSLRVEKLGMSNGMDWSPAGDVLFHVDSTAGTVTAWEYDLVLGELGASRVVRIVPASVGLPDGLTVDADGKIWVAIGGRTSMANRCPHWRNDGNRPGTGLAHQQLRLWRPGPVQVVHHHGGRR